MKVKYDFVFHMSNGNHIGETKPLCKRKAKKFFVKFLNSAKKENDFELMTLAPCLGQDVNWVRFFGENTKDLIKWFNSFK